MSSQADLLTIVEQLAASVAELERWRGSMSTPTSINHPLDDVKRLMEHQRAKAEEELRESREELAAARREFAALSQALLGQHKS